MRVLTRMGRRERRRGPRAGARASITRPVVARMTSVVIYTDGAARKSRRLGRRTPSGAASANSSAASAHHQQPDGTHRVIRARVAQARLRRRNSTDSQYVKNHRDVDPRLEAQRLEDG